MFREVKHAIIISSMGKVVG